MSPKTTLRLFTAAKAHLDGICSVMLQQTGTSETRPSILCCESRSGTFPTTDSPHAECIINWNSYKFNMAQFRIMQFDVRTLRIDSVKLLRIQFHEYVFIVVEIGFENLRLARSQIFYLFPFELLFIGSWTTI